MDASQASAKVVLTTTIQPNVTCWDAAGASFNPATRMVVEVTGTVNPATTTVTKTVTSEDASNGTESPGEKIQGGPNSPEVDCQPEGPGGISGGAVAGAAVGCLVGGLALGFIIAFFLLRRRLRGTNSSAASAPVQSVSTIEPKDNILLAAKASDSDIDLSQFLLDVTPDEQIASELHCLSELIFQHVENHYHLMGVHTSGGVLAGTLVNLGFPRQNLSGLDAETIAALCVEPATRQVGLRHVISSAVFKTLDYDNRSPLSMLPPAIGAFFQTMPQKNGQDVNPHATALALSKWRGLTALLLHPNPSERTPLPLSEQAAAPQANALIEALNPFLQCFVAPDEASLRSQAAHLQAVILECAKLGYVLLSQPSDWRFVFGISSTATRRVVVCPGLEKLGLRDGTRYNSPREVVAPVDMPI